MCCNQIIFGSRINPVIYISFYIVSYATKIVKRKISCDNVVEKLLTYNAAGFKIIHLFKKM